MDLALSEEQQDLQAMFRDFFRREVSGDRVRAAEPVGFDEALWKTLADLGAIGVGIPEEQHGSGGQMLEASILAEQAGAVVAPVPFVDSVVATRLLARLDDDEARALLERVLAGTPRVALAPTPAHHGQIPLVPAGAVIDHLIAVSDGQLRLFEVGNEVHVEHLDNVGSQPFARATIRAGSGHTLVHAEGEAMAHLAAALDEWRVLQAAALVGLARGALALGVEYAKERQQFGVPIATFQAVAHGLADQATSVDGAHLLVAKAAWSCDENTPDATTMALMALQFGGEVAVSASATSLHYHGGYGFMREYDIQLYYRRAAAWSAALGRPADAFDTIADRLWPPRIAAVA